MPRYRTQLGGSDVLIRVHAAGVNPLDSKIRDGEFKPILPHCPPFTLGHDKNGRVDRPAASLGDATVVPR
ncbi:alcohol dehydrogenase catalytic domain-containing protein [Streptomyces sp. NPDC005492]|uniref:alcohol dehydrogenase catalytic domain-containing protein n=1 Tax=Streptomyces sp. NPDC005492 TaxID=3156883 RepID=UPI0033A63A5C